MINLSWYVFIHNQFVASKNEITNRRINEFCFRMFWFWFFGGKTYDCNPSVQVHKRKPTPEFMIYKFHDYRLDPKIKKLGDLLYISTYVSKHHYEIIHFDF